MTIFPFDREENIVGKGKTAAYQHFLLSHNVFYSLLLNLSSTNTFNLDQSKILSFGKQ